MIFAAKNRLLRFWKEARRSLVRTYRNRYSYRLNSYDKWIRANLVIRPDQLEMVDHHAASLPSVHVIWIFTSRSTKEMRRAQLELNQQRFSNWHATFLVQEKITPIFDSEDRRIDVVEIGKFDPNPDDNFVIIDSNVKLSSLALYFFCVMLRSGYSIIYSDEDKVSRNGGRHSPFFKPDFAKIDSDLWFPLGNCFAIRWTVLSKLLINDKFGYESYFLAKQSLLTTIDAEEVAHIPYVLYSTIADGNPRNLTLPQRSVNAFSYPKVSIIIPTRDRVDLLRPCLESILKFSKSYPSNLIEILIVDNQSEEIETKEYFRNIEQENDIKIITYDDSFNYSKINNHAVRVSHGEIIIFLNNDVVISSASWLHRLVANALKPGVGLVGGKLLYPDRTVQHAGVVVGVQALAVHAFRFLDENDGGYCGLANRDRAVSVVTAACAAIRRDLFDALGGFDENLAVAFNDVALCLAAHEAGYTNVSLGETIAFHLESKSRGSDNTIEKQKRAHKEAIKVRSEYNYCFRSDPFYNPNLCVRRPYYLAMVPRGPRPWIDYARKRNRFCNILILTDTSESISGEVSVIAKYLRDQGHRVCVGAPSRAAVGGDARWIRIRTVRDGARTAFFGGHDVVISLSTRFHSIARHLAAGQVLAAVKRDLHGHTSKEKPPSWRRQREREICLAIADLVLEGPDCVQRLGTYLNDQIVGDGYLNERRRMTHSPWA